MDIRATVANAIIRWAMQRITKAPHYLAPWLAGQTIWPEWDTERAIKEGYKASYIYYTGSSDLADCIRSAPWQVKKMTKTGAEVLDTHSLVNMIRRPNAEDTWGALMESWDLYKSLGGNAYGCWKPNGDTVNVWRLRTDRVSIVPDKKGHIAHYAYAVPGIPTPVEYSVEEIFHFKFFDPGSDHYGLSPLQAAATLVDASSAMLTWNKNSMGNRARPDLMLGPKNALSKPQHATLLELLNEQVAGAENAHRTLIPSEPMEILQMSLTPVEMDFIKSFESYEDAVCKVLHIHPEALGKTNATYENKRWAIRAKWEGPVTSRLREMRAVLNHKLGPDYGTAYPPALGDIYLDYDLSNTPAVIEARKEAAEEAKTYWAMGVPFNVISEELDLPFDPIEGGDVGYIPVTLLPTSMSEGQGRSARTINPQSEDQFRAVQRTIDRRKQGWERGVAVKVAQLFAVERKAVVAAIKAGHIDVDYAIDGKRKNWIKVLTAEVRAVIEDFGGQVADEFNQGATEVGRGSQMAIMGLSEDQFELRYEFDPWSVAVEEYVTTSVAEAVTQIQTTTMKAIREVVGAGMKEGESMAKIAKKIEGVFLKWEGEGTGYRSMMIARTEVHSAAGFGMHESARQSGVAQEKHWQDAGDDRVRVAHVANTAAGWIAFNEAYPDGAMYPGDGTDDVGCRCVELYRTR